MYLWRVPEAVIHAVIHAAQAVVRSIVMMVRGVFTEYMRSCQWLLTRHSLQLFHSSSPPIRMVEFLCDSWMHIHSLLVWRTAGPEASLSIPCYSCFTHTSLQTSVISTDF